MVRQLKIICRIRNPDGRTPLSCGQQGKWRQSVLAGSYTPLSEHLKNPPAPWREFFARSLATDRTTRPDSAVQFLLQLEPAFA